MSLPFTPINSEQIAQDLDIQKVAETNLIKQENKESLLHEVISPIFICRSINKIFEGAVECAVEYLQLAKGAGSLVVDVAASSCSIIKELTSPSFVPPSFVMEARSRMKTRLKNTGTFATELISLQWDIDLLSALMIYETFGGNHSGCIAEKKRLIEKMKKRGEPFEKVWDEFKSLPSSEKVDQVMKGIGRMLFERKLIHKGIEIKNQYKYGISKKPPVFANTDFSDLDYRKLSPQHFVKSLTIEELRNSHLPGSKNRYGFKEGKCLFVKYEQNGKSVFKIAPEYIDGYRLKHPELARLQDGTIPPVEIAGDAYIKNGRIHRTRQKPKPITNQTGHYLVTGDHLADTTIHAFKQFGLDEASKKLFSSITTNFNPKRGFIKGLTPAELMEAHLSKGLNKFKGGNCQWILMEESGDLKFKFSPPTEIWNGKKRRISFSELALQKNGKMPKVVAWGNTYVEKGNLNSFTLTQIPNRPHSDALKPFISQELNKIGFKVPPELMTVLTKQNSAIYNPPLPHPNPNKHFQAHLALGTLPVGERLLHPSEENYPQEQKETNEEVSAIAQSVFQGIAQPSKIENTGKNFPTLPPPLPQKSNFDLELKITPNSAGFSITNDPHFANACERLFKIDNLLLSSFCKSTDDSFLKQSLSICNQLQEVVKKNYTEFREFSKGNPSQKTFQEKIDLFGNALKDSYNRFITVAAITKKSSAMDSYGQWYHTLAHEFNFFTVEFQYLAYIKQNQFSLADQLIEKVKSSGEPYQKLAQDLIKHKSSVIQHNTEKAVLKRSEELSSIESSINSALNAILNDDNIPFEIRKWGKRLMSVHNIHPEVVSQVLLYLRQSDPTLKVKLWNSYCEKFSFSSVAQGVLTLLNKLEWTKSESVETLERALIIFNFFHLGNYNKASSLYASLMPTLLKSFEDELEERFGILVDNNFTYFLHSPYAQQILNIYSAYRYVPDPYLAALMGTIALVSLAVGFLGMARNDGWGESVSHARLQQVHKYLDMGRLLEAETTLKTVKQKHLITSSKKAESLFAKARILWLKGQTKEALEELEIQFLSTIENLKLKGMMADLRVQLLLNFNPGNITAVNQSITLLEKNHRVALQCLLKLSQANGFKQTVEHFKFLENKLLQQIDLQLRQLNPKIYHIAILPIQLFLEGAKYTMDKGTVMTATTLSVPFILAKLYLHHSQTDITNVLNKELHILNTLNLEVKESILALFSSFRKRHVNPHGIAKRLLNFALKSGPDSLKALIKIYKKLDTLTRCKTKQNHNPLAVELPKNPSLLKSFREKLLTLTTPTKAENDRAVIKNLLPFLDQYFCKSTEINLSNHIRTHFDSPYRLLEGLLSNELKTDTPIEFINKEELGEVAFSLAVDSYNKPNHTESYYYLEIAEECGFKPDFAKYICLVLFKKEAHPLTTFVKNYLVRFKFNEWGSHQQLDLLQSLLASQKLQSTPESTRELTRYLCQKIRMVIGTPKKDELLKELVSKYTKENWCNYQEKEMRQLLEKGADPDQVLTFSSYHALSLHFSKPLPNEYLIHRLAKLEYAHLIRLFNEFGAKMDVLNYYGMNALEVFFASQTDYYYRNDFTSEALLYAGLDPYKTQSSKCGLHRGFYIANALSALVYTESSYAGYTVEQIIKSKNFKTAQECLLRFNEWKRQNQSGINH